MHPAQTADFAHPKTNVGMFGIEPGMTVVDFGSGSGAYVLEIAETLQNQGHVYAIDVQKDLLTRVKNEAHKRGYKNVEIIWGDLERSGGSKIANGHADVVLISNLLFQLELKEPPLVEALRILRPGGSLIVIDWAESFGGMGPVKKAVFKQQEAQALAEDAGFKMMRTFNAGAHHYGIMFVKPAKAL